MNLNELIQKPTKKDSFLITLYGESGVGKTYTAANCDNPVFIRVEDGTSSIVGKDVALLPLCENKNDVLQQLLMLRDQEHDFKTIVIDSITRFNEYLEKDILESEGKDNLANCCGGYGKVYDVLKQKHLGLITLCKQIANAKGINIIFLAHSLTKNINEPGLETYSYYTIRLHDKVNVLYGDEVDIVGFLKNKKFVSEGKNLKTNNERVLLTYANNIALTKNRFGIEEEIEIKKDTNLINEIKARRYNV